MMRTFIALFCIVAVASAANTCVPDPSDFYWQSPCSGQKWTNVFVISGLQAYQNGQTLDSLGGIDATQDVTVYANITDNYGKSVATPYIDLALQDYTTSLGKCKWSDIPTFGVLNNLDACTIITDNCHFDNNPTTFTLTVNIADLAGSFIGIIQAGTYYGITITFKDGKDTDLLCVYVQDKIIKA